jgi:non-specific serine/threonine protein kinase/serine/threonine-protein kinase
LPLDAWCERHAPDLARRLAGFGAIGAAVAYAHANLIVHRDLKPANVLVERDGRPRLLDFGIAKLIDSTTDGDTLHAALTPPFAAPEQVTGGAITTRTDVYALGALLYWLLSGRVPLETSGLPLAQWVQRIRAERPPPPSRVALHALGASSDLRDDLDAIALKALAKDPDERYASVDALLADIDAARALRPVQARRAARLRRARLFVRRHRVASAAAAAFVLSIGAGLAGMIWQARVATQERNAALAQARRNGIAYDFMQHLFAAYAAAPEKRGVDELVRKAQDDVRHAEASPDRRDSALAVLGELQYLRGDHRSTVEILQPLLDNGAVGLSGAERFRAQCQLAASLGGLGDFRAARHWLDIALREHPALYSADRGGLLACRIVQSYLLRRADNLAAAVDNDRSALRELEANADADRNLLAEAHANLGFSLGLSARNRESIDEFTRAIAVYRALGRGDSEDVAGALAGIANAQMRSGLLREAQASFAQAIAMHRRSNGPSTWLAETLVHAAQLEDTLGHAADAQRLLDEAAPILERQSQAGSQQHVLLTFERVRVAYSAGDAAAFTLARSQLESELRTHFAPEHFFFDLLAYSDAVTRGSGADDLAAARISIERAIAGMRAHSTSHRLLPSALLESARIALQQGRDAEALAAAREALGLLRESEDPAGWQQAYGEALEGIATTRSGGNADSTAALQRLRAQLGAEHRRVRELDVWQRGG